MYLIIALLIATCVTWGAAVWASFQEDEHEDVSRSKITPTDRNDGR